MKGARAVLFFLFSLLLVTIPLNIPFPLTNPENPLSEPNITEKYPQFIEESKASKTPMQSSSPRRWTLLVYMAVDNCSEAAAIDDIKEMEQIGSTNQINILVYVDFESNTTGVNLGATTYNITSDPPPLDSTIFSSPLVTPLAHDPNMGDPETLLNFTIFGQNFAPANHYLLILWGLGAGYEGVCYDEGSDDWLLPGELATVLENTTLDPIEIVVFDASFMGQLEVLYELGSVSDLFLASENSVPKEHFPYHVFLNSLLLFPDSTPQALAAEISLRYIGAYSQGGAYYNNYPVPHTDLCVSVVNSTRLASVITWFSSMLNTVLAPNILKQQYSAISGARGNTVQFAFPQVIDLGSFGYQLAQQLPLLVTGQLGFNLSSSVLNAVVFERHMSGVNGASGLSVSFAEHESASLSLLNDTRYEDFIQAFHAIGDTTGSAPLVPYTGSISAYMDGRNDTVYIKWIPYISVVHTIQLAAYQTGDADFDLYLYDANMNLLARSVETTSSEILQYAVIQAHTYYIRVHSYPGGNVQHGLGACRITFTPSSGINPVFYVFLAATVIGIAILLILSYIGLRWLYAYLSARRERLRAREALIAATAETTNHTPSLEGQCPKCGEEYPPGARFCPKCGQDSSNETESEV